MTIQLTPKQDTVVREAAEWIRSSQGAFQAPWKYLAGYAGAGKSTLAKKLSEEFRVAYCAFTGKAANVLREKGCDGATTLHKLIYRPDEKAVKRADGTQIWSTEFIPREDSPISEYDVVILDEVSMVDAKMATDLLSYGKPVLVLGDPFQLPPVSGEGYFTSKEPTWFLDEVHRQAADSGILRLATDIREGRGVCNPLSYLPEAAVISLEQASASEEELLGWTEIVLVGTHRMRHHFNNQYRLAGNRRGPFPEKGEQLVCLQNDHKRGLLNGAIWNVQHDAQQRGFHKLEIHIQSADDPKQELLVEAWDHDFLGDDAENKLKQMSFYERAKRARFAYGYALTCHKAQGSEYERVIVIDESSTFREHAARWLYTACTRASQKLVLVMR